MSQSDPGFADRGGSEFLFDFDTFERMERAGVLQLASGHVELIEGKILHMAPISADHGDTSGDIYRALESAAETAGVHSLYRFMVHVTLKIDEYSAPEPDVLVTQAFKGRKYCEAADAVLIAEVSISTRENDLSFKAPLYAQAGVPEYWVVEPESRKLTVHREPKADGTWGSVTVLEGDAYVSPLFSSQVHIPLSELF